MEELFKQKKLLQEKIDFWTEEYKQRKNKNAIYFVRINKNLLNEVNDKIKEKKRMEMNKND